MILRFTRNLITFFHGLNFYFGRFIVGLSESRCGSLLQESSVEFGRGIKGHWRAINFILNKGLILQ